MRTILRNFLKIEKNHHCNIELKIRQIFFWFLPLFQFQV